MSDKKQKLRHDLHHSNQSEDRSGLKTQINRLQNDIKKQFKTLHEQKAEELAQEINSTDSARACFAATRQLAGIKKSNTISVHDDNNNFVATNVGKATILKNHFEKKVYY